mgnify:CR=1 FL=1
MNTMRHQISIAVLCLVMMALKATANENDWPSFRGMAARGGVESKNPPIAWDATSANDPAILWRASVPGLGHSRQGVFGGKVVMDT